MRILYLDIDTLRADHLGCYGYGRATSPNIDRIAAQGVRFENYYCSDAPCQPSRTAMMTGRFGIHNGVVGHGGIEADLRLEGPSRDFQDTTGRECLPAFLRKQGLKTVTISPFAERHSAWYFYAGFNEMYNTGGCGMESAEEITPTALDWIARNAKRDDWFLHINYWDPHTPYRAPAEIGNPFEKDPGPEWITEEVFQSHRKMAGPHKPQEIYMYDNQFRPQYPRHPGELKNLADVKRFFDGYDTGIQYADAHVGQILDALRRQGVLDDVAIIVSSDHGENMGEFGIYGEHATADEPTCRIPMIVKWPGCQAGRVDRGLHYNLDLAPTLAEWFGKKPCPSWEGASWAGALQGRECGRPYLVLSQLAHVCQRSVRFGPWLYLRTWHDGFHLFPDEMLFNLDEDPYQQCDLASSRTEICREGLVLYTQWHDGMMATMRGAEDPLSTVMGEGGPFHARGYLKEYCKRLESTGRGGAVVELRRRHPEEFS